jgi:phosphohistidine phosphatase
MIYLVHHAEALPPSLDAMRPLSDRGRAQAQLLAFNAARLGVKPECIWHSGKRRARQTAECFWRECNPFATLSAERGLLPDDPPGWMRDRFFGETRELMAVGHMPHLDRLLRLMLGAHVGSTAVAFPLNGMVALEGDGERWIERWRLES